MRKIRTFQCILLFAVAAMNFAVVNSVFAAVPGPCTADNVRWASSSNRIYIEGGVVECTLTEVKAFGSSSMPLELIDPIEGVWFLGANIFIRDGAKLIIHGTTVGGAVNELRLKSNNATSTGSFITIRADWGTIDIDSTKITSWDASTGGPDTEYASYGRAYIRVQSRLDKDGVTPRESRMDIKNSDIGYLGYAGSEAYGLSWKVLGKDVVGTGIFDLVGVYGDVVNNKIHHNYFGVYTYGADAMTFIDNEVYESVVYGIDPHDDSDDLVIDSNSVHDNGYHGIICSKRCNNLTITNNESFNNGGNGIMLHRNVTDSLVKDNYVHDNVDSGIALFESHNNQISNNTAKYNRRGIRLSVGSSNNIIEDNIFSENDTHGLFFYKGSSLPTSGDGRVKLNIFRNNTVNGNGSFAARIKKSDSNLFENNDFIGNGMGVYFAGDAPKNNTLSGNTIKDNGNDYNVKLYMAPETIIENNVIEGSKYGILISNSNDSEILNNNVKFSTKTGIRLQNGSSGNLISGNIIDGHVRGVDVVGLSENNIISENQIINNTSYAVYIYNADNNTFENNTLTGNALNYYYAKYDAVNIIKDSDVFSVKIGDALSNMTISDSTNAILKNSKNRPTNTSPSGSSIVLDQTTVGKSVVNFNRLNFTVIPSLGGLAIRPLIWDTSGDLYKKWKAVNSATSTIAVSHTIGDLAPGTDYDVVVSGILFGTFTANSSGEISFDRAEKWPGTRTFEIKESL